MMDLDISSVTKLRNGVEMPLLGLGLSHNGGYSDDAVKTALDVGIRHFDTVSMIVPIEHNSPSYVPIA